MAALATVIALPTSGFLRCRRSPHTPRIETISAAVPPLPNIIADSQTARPRLFPALIPLLLLVASLSATTLQPETSAALDHYVHAAEQRMAVDQSAGNFFYLDALPPSDRRTALDRLHHADVLTQPLEALDAGHSIPIPGGLVHHWIGAVFIPGATLQQTLAFLQDYDHQSRFYAPDVQRSRLLSRDGNHFQVSLRLKRTKVVTVFLDTEYDVTYSQLDATRSSARSYSTRIAEVENAGRPNERDRPVGQDHGFLWRLNSYWHFIQRDGGTYVQLEAISLTRDIPTGADWIVRPFIASIPQESLAFTLTRTREALTPK